MVFRIVPTPNLTVSEWESMPWHGRQAHCHGSPFKHPTCQTCHGRTCTAAHPVPRSCIASPAMRGRTSACATSSDRTNGPAKAADCRLIYPPPPEEKRRRRNKKHNKINRQAEQAPSRKPGPSWARILVAIRAYALTWDAPFGRRIAWPKPPHQRAERRYAADQYRQDELDGNDGRRHLRFAVDANDIYCK